MKSDEFKFFIKLLLLWGFVVCGDKEQIFTFNPICSVFPIKIAPSLATDKSKTKIMGVPSVWQSINPVVKSLGEAALFLILLSYQNYITSRPMTHGHVVQTAAFCHFRHWVTSASSLTQRHNLRNSLPVRIEWIQMWTQRIKFLFGFRKAFKWSPRLCLPNVHIPASLLNLLISSNTLGAQRGSVLTWVREGTERGRDCK